MVINLIFLMSNLLKFWYVVNLLSKIKFMDRFFNWLYERTYKKRKNVMKYGAIGLSLFVAIPLPITGAWTGSMAAIVFNIKPKYALPAIFLGVIIAGIVVSFLVSLGYFIAH